MKKILGIELGSTRIKSVLIDEETNVIAQGSHEWENRWEDGYWTYSLDDVWTGLQQSYRALKEAYQKNFGKKLTELDAIGISAMMHGYLAFGKDEELLVPFRTWRNTTTKEAASELSELFAFNVPQRWSVSHYYQAVLNGEPHISQVISLNTLAGYVHEKLTGRRVLGVGDASGMFPIQNGTYNQAMLSSFDTLLKEKHISTPFVSLLPEVLLAGEDAGKLTEHGARLLDPSGELQAGCLLCPPEGDAGTGMVATNSIAPRTANISAGTSAFLMAVLEHDLSHFYEQIDVVTTPTGSPVAMVHVNNFTSEINAWASLFGEVAELFGAKIEQSVLFDTLLKQSRHGDADCGGLMGYNFLSGEHIAEVSEGRPLLMRKPDGTLNVANFMKTQIYSALGTLAIGMEILKQENVTLDSVSGHGGFFKTDFIGQSAASAALDAPVTVMKNAGEGGAWGIALLALFASQKNGTLADFLNRLFANTEQSTVCADEREKADFAAFLTQYKAALAIEQAAADHFH